MQAIIPRTSDKFCVQLHKLSVFFFLERKIISFLTCLQFWSPNDNFEKKSGLELHVLCKKDTKVALILTWLLLLHFRSRV